MELSVVIVVAEELVKELMSVVIVVVEELVKELMSVVRVVAKELPKVVCEHFASPLPSSFFLCLYSTGLQQASSQLQVPVYPHIW